MSTAAATPETHLARFGLKSFRPGQREVIESVLAGKDCLCIMPTGGGKSLCYQLPAIARQGLTLVVSPLIALMKDQVDALTANGIRATCINSTVDGSEQSARLRQMAAGGYDLVYVAPERFRSPYFIEALRSAELQLLAVDEAHCISEWGHDFRPDYARIGRFRRRFGNLQTIALTATATPHVRDDVIRLLDLHEPQVFITGFSRPNLRFEVFAPRGQRDKQQLLLDLLRHEQGAGIIYAATRKRCEELAESLASGLRRRVGIYHAGMLPDDRRQVQEDLMSGRLGIVVATNAFGMGIDKSDLRFVVHYNLPGSIEAYYQEAGRAGRDGLPSRCLLLYTANDRDIQEFFIENSYPAPEHVRAVYEFLRGVEVDPIELTQQEIRETLGLPIGVEGVGACQQLLEKSGAIERLEPRQNMAAVRIDSDLPTLVDLLPTQAKVRRAVLRGLEKTVGELRFDRVYFHPHELAQRLELDRTAVARALRELSELKAIDYIPPFRGRAVHVVDRARSFAELEIDFEELGRRKEYEYQKLNAVVAYALSASCRQEVFLEYFGDPSKKSCGTCDNCSSAGPTDDPPPAVGGEETPGVLRGAQIALAGAARTRGRCGKHLVAKMLCGSSSAQLVKLGFDQLSTFGLLSRLRQSEAVDLLDALLAARLLEQVEVQARRPVVQITAAGESVMRGEVFPQAPLPLPSLVRRKLASLGEPVRADRSESDEVGPSTTFLEDPVRKNPEPRTDESPVPEVAEGRPSVGRAVERLGGNEPEVEFDLVDGAADWPWPDTNPDAPVHEVVPSRSEPKRGAAPEAGGGYTPAEFVAGEELGFRESERADAHEAPRNPPWYWSWRLLCSGYSAPECAEIRNLSPRVVAEHVVIAAQQGLPVEPRWLLNPTQLATLERLLDAAGPRPSFEAILRMAPGIQAEHIRLVEICRAARRG